MKDPSSLTVNSEQFSDYKDLKDQKEGRNMIPAFGRFGKWIDETCRKKGWSIRKFSEITGTNYETIQRMRTGSKVVGRQTLKTILSCNKFTPQEQISLLAAWSHDLMEEIKK